MTVENLPTTVLYFRRDDGAVSEVRTTRPDLTRMPAGYEPISAEEYHAGLELIQQATAEHVARLVADDDADHAADYQALRAAGIPDATARRLSSYDGETLA